MLRVHVGASDWPADRIVWLSQQLRLHSKQVQLTWGDFLKQPNHEIPTGDLSDDEVQQYKAAYRGPDSIEQVRKDGCHVLVAGRPSAGHLEVFRQTNATRVLLIPWAGLPEETRLLLCSMQKELKERDPAHFVHALHIYNVHHNADETAESALALVLSCAKLIPLADRHLRSGDWALRYPARIGLRQDASDTVDEHVRTASVNSLLLRGKTAVVIGAGAVGQRVVCMLGYGFGMNVVVVRRTAVEANQDRTLEEMTRTPDDEKTAGSPQPQWQRVCSKICAQKDLLVALQGASVVVIAVPLTVETENMIGTVELNAMAPDGILVNVGRAKIVDQGALYAALRNHPLNSRPWRSRGGGLCDPLPPPATPTIPGQGLASASEAKMSTPIPPAALENPSAAAVVRGIGCAGLDVWYNYPSGDMDSISLTWPCAPETPLHLLNNVVMSPHRAGRSFEVDETRFSYVLDALQRIVRDWRSQQMISDDLPNRVHLQRGY